MGPGPVIATVSPVYLPQGNSSGTAITASGGYLYVVEGHKLYKVNERTLKTVQVSTLVKGRTATAERQTTSRLRIVEPAGRSSATDDSEEVAPKPKRIRHKKAKAADED